MRSIWYKVASILLLVAMLLSLVTGCGAGGTQKSEENQTTVAKETPKGPPVELTVEVFDRSTPGYQADNNFLTKWIQEKFGTPNNINVKFVPVLRAQEVDKLNVLMASNSAPDICFTYNAGAMQSFVKNGGLTDLGDLIDKNAPNLKKYLGDDLLSYGKFSGVLYAIPAKRTLQASISAFIRKDWLDALSLPIPKTTEELYNTLKAFKEKDPGKLGDKLIPYCISPDPQNVVFPAYTLLDSFKTKMSDEDAFCMSNWEMPGFKEGMRLMNKMYNEGLINKQFVLDKDGKQAEKDRSQGRVGFFISNYDQPYRTTPGEANELKKNVPDGLFIPIDPFTNYEGKHLKVLYNPNGMNIIIPKSSKRAVEAMKYLEWMSDPAVLKYLQNGDKGVQYTDENDGIPAGFIPNDKLPDDKKYNFTDLAIIVNGKEFGSKEKNIQAASFGYPGYEDLYKQAYNIAITDGRYEPHFDRVIESEAKYSKTLTDKGTDLYVKSITSKPADFDKTYDSLLAEYMKAGGQEVTTEKKAAYKEMKK